MDFPIAVLATSAPHFPLDLAAASFKRCLARLRETFPFAFAAPEGIITGDPGDREILDEIKAAGPKALILVQGAFTWDDIAAKAYEHLGKIPTLLWALPEPETGSGVLSTNSLCGALMNNAAFHKLGFRNLFLYGDPDDPSLEGKLGDAVRALACAGALPGARYGMVGYRPTGFYNSTFDELRVRREFGVETRYLDLAELCDAMEAMPAGRIEEDVTAALQLGKPGQADRASLETGARVHLALKDFIQRERIDFLGARCWPELMRKGANPCMVLGRLTGAGVPAACESDFGGALTMFLLARLSGGVPWLADLINADAERGALHFWHCGAAPASLADPAKERIINKQFRGLDRCNSLEFTLKPGPVTVARFGLSNDRFRIFAFTGQATAPAIELRGNLSEITPSAKPQTIIKAMTELGVEHHLGIVYGDRLAALSNAARLLGIEFHAVR